MAEMTDQRLKFQLFFWYGVIALSALVFSYFLAAGALTILLMVGAVGWLMLLPYHATLSFKVAVATFGSAFILPLFPGRPYFWELAALLGWSGLIMLVALRRYDPGFKSVIRRNAWMFIGIIGYCAVLVMTMFYRGFGLRVLGSSGQVGGRLYLQQLVCAIFPLLFAMIRTDERTVVRLVVWQCLLTASYLLSDFAFSFGSDLIYPMLYFVELANDALLFEVQSATFGIRRFQSLALAGHGFILLTLVYLNLKDFLSPRRWLMLAVVLGIFSIGLLSGHRYFVILLAFTLLFVGYSQRFFTTRNVLIAGVMLGLGIGVLYLSANRMPLAFQRAVSFLPGLHASTEAVIDAQTTAIGRVTLFKVGLTMIPEYFWLGRGFVRYMDEYSGQFDPTGVMAHISNGVFYNGFIGLMVNTGVFGTFFMFLFILAGTRTAFRIIKFVRRNGCEDDFSRVCSLMASLWIAHVLLFLFLHGDAERAMKTFALVAGLCVLCEKLLNRRLSEVSATAE